MSGSKLGGLKTAQTIKDRFGQDYYHKIGTLGGRAGTGHSFAHGKVDPHVAGKRGGGNKGTRSPAWRAAHSEAMKAVWAQRRQKEQVFVPDSSDFGAGFFAPTRMQRVLNKIRSK